MMTNKDIEKQLAAKEAVKLVRNNQIVGLGTGSTAYYAVVEIGRLVKEGLQIKAIPTSDKTKTLAEELGIPLIDINTVDAIDITIDGADEFTENLQLIKGGGGALLREKIVASITKEEIIIADSSKQVQQLGKFTVPIETIPFAANGVANSLQKLQGKPQVRMQEGQPFITDEGNYILDTDFGLIADPAALATSIKNIAGVVEHGLFINLAKRVIMGKGDGTIVFE
jgi:ribose 5-phosphate isomerase A